MPPSSTVTCPNPMPARVAAARGARRPSSSHTITCVPRYGTSRPMRNSSCRRGTRLAPGMCESLYSPASRMSMSAQAAKNTREDQEEGKVGALLDEEGAHDVVQGSRDDGPHEHDGAPQVLVLPVQPDHGADEDGHSPDLGHAEQEHDRGEQRRMRHAGDGEPDAAEHGLDQRGDHDAEGDGTNGLGGEAG